MDDEQRQHLENLRQTEVRRLRVLEQRAAQSGTNTPPEVQLEIEDLQSEIDKLDAQLAPPSAELHPAQPQTLQEQRKLVTVFRAQLNGLTNLATELDPEDMAEILADLRRRGIALIVRFNGHADIQTDGQVTALWGAEVAREDDPEQAVRAALAMRDELAAFNSEHRLMLDMHIGISTGIALLSAGGAMGEPVVMGGRLAQIAPTSGILIAHETYLHVRGLFDMQPLDTPAAQAKPIAQTFLVQQARPRPFRIESRGIEGIASPMIGRDAELKYLQDALYTMLEDRERQAITIVADAGVGKSRLLDEFLAWVDLLPEPILLFKGRASPSTQARPFALLQDVFTLSCDIQDSDLAAIVREKLERGFGQAFGEGEPARRCAQIIGRMLGFIVGDTPQLREVADDPQQIHHRGLIELTTFFRLRAQQVPVILLLEDLHWADDSSLNALAELAEALAGSRLIILGATRPGLYERRPHWGEGQPFHNRLDLRPLTSHDTRRLVEEVLQRLDRIPIELRDLLVANADGNPFYVEELVKMLIDIGTIHIEDAHWSVDLAQLSLRGVPMTITGVLQTRLDCLSANEQSVLQRAATIGRNFWDAAVAYLGGAEAAQVVPLEALHSLRQRDLIYQRERSMFVTASEFTFKHALLREVAYARVLRRARRLYHSQAAHWLVQVAEQSKRADEHAILIAQHYDQASEAQAAATWYTRAGHHAAARYCNAAAVAAFSSALELTPEDDATTRYDLILAREKAYDQQGAHIPQAHDLILLEQLAAALGDDARQATIALRRAIYTVATGDATTALAYAQQAAALAEAASMPIVAVGAYDRWAVALQLRGEYTAGRLQAERGLELARRIDNRPGEASLLRILGAITRAQLDYDAARAAYDQSLHICRQIGDRRGEAKTLIEVGTLAWFLSEYGAARAAYEQGLLICREIDDQHAGGFTLVHLGILACMRGNDAAARVHLDEALQIARKIGDRRTEGLALINLGSVAHLKGDHTGAYATSREALHILQALREPDKEAVALNLMGHLLVELGRPAVAAVAYQKSLDIQRRLGQPHLATEPLAGLARVAQISGDYAVALTHVEAILAHLASGGLGGTATPLRVYLTCYQVLQAMQDSRAATLLKEGFTLLQEQAAMIPNEAEQRMYMENVSWHRAIVAAWRAETHASNSGS